MKEYLLAGAAFAAIAFGAGAAFADPWGLRRTCPQVWMNGPVVTAVCYNAFGGLVRSSINSASCGYAGVGNFNGQLGCYGGGPAYAPPPAYGYPGPGWRERRHWN